MADSIQLLRQWQLLRMLSARRHGATLRELAAEAGCSQKTLQRDLQLLRRLGFPIIEAIGPHGRKQWSLKDNAGLAGLSFTLEEAAALYLGRQFLEGLAGTMFWQGAQSAFGKIRSALGEPALRHLQQLGTAVHLTTRAVADYESRATMIDELMIAIEDRKLTVITYQSLRATEPVTLYDIHPYTVAHHLGALYVIAWSKDHEEIRTFKIDRISDVTLHGLQFERPHEYDPATYLGPSFGIFAGKGPPQTIRIRFTAKVARILHEKQFHPSQMLIPQQDGSVVAEYSLSSFEEFATWILGFGPQAEVLEPPALREQVRESLLQASRLYASSYEPQPRGLKHRAAR